MFKTEWAESLQKYERIMIFGAKQNAVDTYLDIKRYQRDILCFVVSEQRDNPHELLGKPVKTFEQIEAGCKENGLVVISHCYNAHDKMKDILAAAGFRHIIGSQQSILAGDNLRKEACAVLGAQRMTVRELAAQRREHDTKPDIPICIYAVTSDRNLHVANRAYTSRYVKYIQAGAALTSRRICDVTDDVGDNISKWNAFFCELTAGYWIYRNDTKNAYVGLCHYSRGFDISDEEIERIAEAGVDVVLPVPHIFRHEMAAMVPSEVAVIMEAIERVSPEFTDSARTYFMNRAFIAGNLIFARKEIFCHYYTWLFQVLQECARIKQGNKVKIEERVFGYYGENLMNIFFVHNRERYEIRYSEVISML